jgi:hypothetical protein
MDYPTLTSGITLLDKKFPQPDMSSRCLQQLHKVRRIEQAPWRLPVKGLRKQRGTKPEVDLSSGSKSVRRNEQFSFLQRVLTFGKYHIQSLKENHVISFMELEELYPSGYELN